MSLKEMAVSFLKMAGTGQVQDAYDKFISPDFIHHNLHFRGDRQSLLKAMQEAHQVRPNKSVDVKHVYQDGDTVITHSLVEPTSGAEASIAVVHILRFQNDKVVELWDLGQEIPSKSHNKNGPF